MARKKNPTVVLKESDVRRIKEKATKESVEKAFVIFFSVLHDKWGFGQKRLARMLKHVTDLGNMLDEKPRCVTLQQLEEVLQDELGIYF